MLCEVRHYTQNPVLVRRGPAVRLAMPTPVLADAPVQLFKQSIALGQCAITVTYFVDSREQRMNRDRTHNLTGPSVAKNI
jgi:hypothetical protein